MVVKREQSQAEYTTMELESKLPYLPSEIKGLVVEHLQKSDLKNLRRVCKEWSVEATHLLFDRIFISPYSQDLRVFTKITENPDLAKSVKELVCDVSTVSERSLQEYFFDLCIEIRDLIGWLSSPYPFYSSSRQLNQFVNEIIRYDKSDEELFSAFGNGRKIKTGFRTWQQLAAEKVANMGCESCGAYYTTLCSGLSQLQNLQTVNMDFEIWSDNLSNVGRTLYPANHLNPYHALGVVYSGSPLSRSWDPWHLRPTRPKCSPEDEALEYLSVITRALSRTQRQIKHFHCNARYHDGLSPMVFARFEMTSSFPHHMAIALHRLEHLELQITPRQYHFMEECDSDALGFLPQLLEQMTSLKYLELLLASAKRLERVRRLKSPLLDDACLTYPQVFPQQGKWPHLKMFYIRGLAIDGLDLLLLLSLQMPQLKRLWLDRIDLLETTWESMVEALRSLERPWELFSLQGSFRHKTREWWPCAPDQYDQEWFALRGHADYIEDGGRHPSLPIGCHDSESKAYLYEMLFNDREDRLQSFRRRAKALLDSPV